MSPQRFAGLGGRCGFPRVSGDEPGLDTVHCLSGAFSPRERG